MKRPDLLVGLGLLVLAALFFAPVVFGGRVLVPFDSLFRFPPWSAFAAQYDVTVPHNDLVLDLVVENYVWKQFIVESLRSGVLPLWNPYLFAGVPFLAAGQHSALYPFSLLFYVLPVDRAFGYFVALQLAIAAIAMYFYMRILGTSRLAAVTSGIVYAFSGFMVVSTTFPMVLGAAAWLPAVLGCVETSLRDVRSTSHHNRAIAFLILGAVILGIQFLAGHIEISIYVLIVTGLYSLFRIFVSQRVSNHAPSPSPVDRMHVLNLVRSKLVSALLIGAMIGIGMALASVQLIPLFELVQQNFRSGSVTFQDVVGWAYSWKQIVTFLIPDFFGNPTHHSYLDVFDLTLRSAPSGTIFWGPKNYVEAGAYVGVLPLLLAGIAIASSLRWQVSTFKFMVLGRRQGNSGQEPDVHDLKPYVFFFTLLALLSLLFAFGTPLYGFLFYFVPGFDQLHTPFRWVFPYTLCMSILAGMGVEILGRHHTHMATRWISRFAIVAGASVLLTLGLSRLFPTATLLLADRLLQASNTARTAFSDGRMFYSYEFRNLFLFGATLLCAGLGIHSARSSIRLPARMGSGLLWKPLVLVVTVADLFIIGFGFYPSADPRLGEFTPPSVEFLRQDLSLFRVTSYDNPGEKVLNANGAMLYGIADIRGYDSIIPKQYTELMGLLAPQDDLLANRIAPFYSPDPLDSPVVRLLNVKYVLSTRPLPNAGYTLVYDHEIKIYRNDRVLPRAFVVPQAQVIPDRARLLEQMREFDPATQVLLEQTPDTGAAQAPSERCTFSDVETEKYSANEVVLRSDQRCSGWLVISDSYFPGWVAQVDDKPATLYRADYNFRSVFLPAGAHTVRLKYSPLSFRVGAIGSFLGAMLVLIGIAYLGWKHFYGTREETPVQVVAKNSLLPMASSLLMKVMDLAFALFWLRVLGPTGTGRYGWAVTIWYLANTVTDFGLGILLTREVSRDRSQANRYLTNATILRIALWGVALLPLAFVAAIYVRFFGVTPDTVLALGYLIIGILPSTLAASLAFLFNAFERFEYRVAVDVMTRIVSITLGIVVLLLGYGYVGLAAVSILTNLFTLGVFFSLVRSKLFVPHLEIDRPLIRWMFFESYPLMLNNLLSGLFFRIDVLILQPLKGDTVLGYYSTAYKFIDALNFIPSNFTLAIFPALSRMAASAKEAMLRAYLLSLKLLLWIALPITVGTVFVSRELISLFGGSEYLPHSGIALQVLIWFLPFSFMNSVTHYVLIALGQQRFLTKAFILGAIFNVAANLVAIPPLGYVGASLTTILSEIVLLVPFYLSVRKNLAPVPFVEITWRPVVAAGIMGVLLWWMLPWAGLLPAVVLAGLLYVALLVGLGALGKDERALLRRLLPERWHFVVRASNAND